MKRVNINDYLGNTFGNLTVTGFEIIENKTFLVARCSCGADNIKVQPYRIGKDKKSCGCLKTKSKVVSDKHNLVGEVFEKLTVISLYNEPRQLKRGKTRQWVCLCACGNTCVVAGNNLKSGNTKSCGCLKYLGYNRKPGKFRNKVYSAWKNAKFRCYDDSYDSTAKYKGRGIIMSDEFLDDFETFYNYIGDPPSEEYTLERINVNGNYERGNLKWVPLAFQARNKTKSDRNVSGVTGVYIPSEKGNKRAVAFWHEYDPLKCKYVVKSKSFSFNKYGEVEAFNLAVAYREAQIQRLNSLGYGYTENHGK